jgi:5-methylthioribose kinase
MVLQLPLVKNSGQRRDIERGRRACSCSRSFLSSCTEVSSFLVKHQDALAIDVSSLVISEVENGRMNFVFKASSTAGRSFLIKSSPPHVKSLGSSFLLTQKRLMNESQALDMILDGCGGASSVPELILYDDEQNAMVAGFIADAQDMRRAFFRPTHPLSRPDASMMVHLARQLGIGLATIHYNNSIFALSDQEVSDLHRSFHQDDVFNGSLHVLLLDAFDPTSSSNRYVSELEVLISGFRQDARVKKAHDYLLHCYRTQREGLIHNDLHIGNVIFQTSLHPQPYIIDWELALVGPMSSDVGSLIGNFLLANVCSQYPSCHPVAAGQDWNDALCVIWLHYSSTFRTFISTMPQEDQDRIMKRLWKETCGFAATTVARLTIGIHHFPPLDEMSKEDQVVASKRLIEISRKLLYLLSNSLEEGQEAISLDCLLDLVRCE